MKKIRLFKPYVSWLSRIYALIVLSGTQIAEGPVVRTFEREFGKKFGKTNVVAVNSGTTALELAYELAGIGPGDEVITPVLTCTATNLPLVRRGAKIVFADINGSLNIDIEDIQRNITPKTKAIVFVHFGGNSSGLGQLMELAARHKICVIEDAAQVVGAPNQFWGKADFTCVSLQAIKTLTAGDGGMLICKNADDYRKAKKLRWFGYDRELKQKMGDTDLELAGYKYHMNDISAAIGLGNLRRIDYLLKRRQIVREWYRKHFSALDRKATFEGNVLLYPWLTILIHPYADALEPYLKSKGIDCGAYHYRNDIYSVFGGTDYPKPREGEFPNMDRLQKKYLLLPFHHDITESQVRRIVREINNFTIPLARYREQKGV